MIDILSHSYHQVGQYTQVELTCLHVESQRKFQLTTMVSKNLLADKGFDFESFLNRTAQNTYEALLRSDQEKNEKIN